MMRTFNHVYRLVPLLAAAGAVVLLAGCGGHPPPHPVTPHTAAATPVAVPSPELTPIPGQAADQAKIVCDEAKLAAALGRSPIKGMRTTIGMLYANKNLSIPSRAEINTYIFKTVTNECPKYISEIPVP